MSEVQSAKAPIFIVGCGRSGTTMLRLMLDAHPDLAIPGESNFIPYVWRERGLYVRGDQLDLGHLLPRILNDESVRRWNLPEDLVRERIGRLAGHTLSSVIDAIYSVYATTQGKVRWGDKTPMYVQALPLLANLFPTARFVHLVRDPRNVTLSYLDVARELRYPGVPTTVFQAADRWRRWVGAGVRSGRELGARYVEIRYEDLVADTVRTLGVVSTHCGLDMQSVMLESHSRACQRLEAAPEFARFHANTQLPPTEGMRDWRLSMETSDVEMVEAVAGPLLLEFGYEPMYPRIRMRRRLEAGTRRTIRTGYVGGSRAKRRAQMILTPYRSQSSQALGREARGQHRSQS